MKDKNTYEFDKLIKSSMNESFNEVDLERNKKNIWNKIQEDIPTKRNFPLYGTFSSVALVASIIILLLGPINQTTNDSVNNPLQESMVTVENVQEVDSNEMSLQGTNKENTVMIKENEIKRFRFPSYIAKGYAISGLNIKDDNSYEVVYLKDGKPFFVNVFFNNEISSLISDEYIFEALNGYELYFSESKNEMMFEREEVIYKLIGDIEKNEMIKVIESIK